MNLTGLVITADLLFYNYQIFPSKPILCLQPKSKSTGKISSFQRKTSIYLAWKGFTLWRALESKTIKKDDITSIMVWVMKSRLGCLLRFKLFVTMHDLIFLRYPQYYKFIDRLFTTSKVNMHVSVQDHIIAISEQTKMTLLNITRLILRK